MKRIFIATFGMEIGGAERSLIGLLESIDRSRCQVDLFLYSHRGEFMGMIPDHVHLLPEIQAYSQFQKPIAEVWGNRLYYIAAVRLLSKLYVSLRSKMISNVRDSLLNYYCRYSLPVLPVINDFRYDLAISFLTPHDFVLEKISAKRKVAWVHTDYSTANMDKNFEIKVWERYDTIASVSESCREAFISTFPALRYKVMVIENILSPRFVEEQAKIDVSAEMPDELGVTKICTVGRFSHAKGFDNAVAICRKLVDMGCNIKWYAVGYGGDEPIIRKKIRQLGVEDRFIILGKKLNPYPYMKACDIYVQPSRYEGKAVTVREAQMLHKPVIITNFATAPSQVRDGYDGIIAPMDIEECARRIRVVMNDRNLMKRLVQNTRKCNYGNQNEVEKLYALM